MAKEVLLPIAAAVAVALLLWRGKKSKRSDSIGELAKEALLKRRVNLVDVKSG